MKKHLVVSTGVVLVTALIATSVAFALPASSTLHLTAKDNGKSFMVHRHTTIVITLVSCGDCGYRWHRGWVSGVKVVSHRYVQHHHGQAVGGMGKEIWRFTVVGPASKGDIQLRYVSPTKHVTKRFEVGLTLG